MISTDTSEVDAQFAPKLNAVIDKPNTMMQILVTEIVRGSHDYMMVNTAVQVLYLDAAFCDASNLRVLRQSDNHQ